KGTEKLTSEIKERYGSAAGYLCDITNLQEVENVGKKVVKEVGEVTIVVNNAGILQNVLFTDLDPAKIKKTLEVNVLSHFWV
ncbi:17-beta-hydroxysteroid dehydrogenase 13, partial [Nephila pilipes]